MKHYNTVFFFNLWHLSTIFIK